jgi:hypothetical protein
MADGARLATHGIAARQLVLGRMHDAQRLGGEEHQRDERSPEGRVHAPVF